MKQLSTLFIGIIMTMFNQPSFSQTPSVIALDSPNSEVLLQPVQAIDTHELENAREIGNRLMQALQPYFPAAGLAAPQIGVSKAIFIYSYDRDPKNLELVINPSFIPLGEEKVEGWEGCLSSILNDGTVKIAKLWRYENIKVSYWNAQGVLVEKNLNGFAAKVFQHEYDHLQGIVNVNKPQAIVKSFGSKEEWMAFMHEVKKEDAKSYQAPE